MSCGSCLAQDDDVRSEEKNFVTCTVLITVGNEVSKKHRESTLPPIIIYQILISQEHNSYKTTKKEKCINNISGWKYHGRIRQFW